MGTIGKTITIITLVLFLAVPIPDIAHGDGDPLMGDIDGDGKVTMADAILALQVLSGLSPGTSVHHEADVNGDDRIGMTEALYIFQQLSKTIEHSYTRTVGSAGGTFEFPGGIVMKVPAGAVPEDTTITVQTVPCSMLNPIIGASPYSSHEKRCIGGFTAEPDGLTFAVPVTVTVPVSLPDPDEVPVPLIFDLAKETYRRAPADMIYDRDRGVVEMKISHFTTVGNAAEKIRPEERYEKSCPDGEFACWAMMAPLCSSCTPLRQNIQYCQTLSRPQDICCMLNTKAARDYCYGKDKCYCCMEQLMHVKAVGVDFSVGSCQILGDTVETIFPKCPGSPKFIHSVGETSDDCPKDMNFTVSIDPPTDTLPVCTEKKLKATMTGISSDGKVTLTTTSDIFNPIWDSLNKDVADFVKPDGTIRGFKTGAADITAGMGNNPKVTPGSAKLTVTCHACTMSLSTTQDSVEVGKSLMIAASIFDNDGKPFSGHYNNVKWQTNDTSRAHVTSMHGEATSLVGDDRGPVTVTATYKDLCEEKTASIEITVLKPNVTVKPDQATISVSETKQLAASVIDGGSCSLAWYSSNVNVVDVNASGLVTGKAPGTVNITAVCGDAIGFAKITVFKPKVTVQPNKVNIGFGIECAKQLKATVTDSAGKPYTGCSLAWYSSNVNVVDVNASGLVTGKALGTVNITAVCGGGLGVSVVTVSKKSFAGSWDTYWEPAGISTYTPLTLVVNGTNVTGSYSYEDIIGRIAGNLSADGRDLVGTWYEWGPGYEDDGTFEFLLYCDGNSFIGTWNGVYDWHGTRR